MEYSQERRNQGVHVTIKTTHPFEIGKRDGDTVHVRIASAVITITDKHNVSEPAPCSIEIIASGENTRKSVKGLPKTKNRPRLQRICDPKEIRKWYNEYKRTLTCCRCGAGPEKQLCFHHTNEETKEHAVSSMINGTFTKEQILKEMSQCIVLCFLCHMKDHRWLPKVPSQ